MGIRRQPPPDRLAEGEDEGGEEHEPGHQSGEEGGRGGQEQQSPGRAAGKADDDQAPKRQALHAAGGAPARPAHGDLAGKQRDGRGDIGRARIEPGEEQGRKGDEGSAARQRVLHPGPESGHAEQEKKRHETTIERIPDEAEISVA